MKQARVSRQKLSRLRLGRHGRGTEGEQVAKNQDSLSDKSALAFQDELAYPLLTCLFWVAVFLSYE